MGILRLLLHGLKALAIVQVLLLLLLVLFPGRHLGLALLDFGRIALLLALQFQQIQVTADLFAAIAELFAETVELGAGEGLDAEALDPFLARRHRQIEQPQGEAIAEAQTDTQDQELAPAPGARRRPPAPLRALGAAGGGGLGHRGSQRRCRRCGVAILSPGAAPAAPVRHAAGENQKSAQKPLIWFRPAIDPAISTKIATR